MRPWNERPPDVAGLFNPAFCGRLLVHTVFEHQPESVPFVLVPLVLPLILHRKTRDILPTSIRSAFITWVEQHPEVRLGLADRVTHALPVTREALLFMTSRGWLSIEGATVSATRPKPLGSSPRDTDEVKDCVLKARLLGRWFRHAGRPATIYAALAITP